MQLEGASAVVTGGGGGLGAGTVRRLAAAGMKVVVADFSEENGKRLADELSDSAVFVQTDVCNDTSLQNAIDTASELGPLRVAVAAHGGKTALSRILDRDGNPFALDLFRMTVETYLTGTFNVLRLSAAAMAKTEPLADGQRGVVVMTASIAAMEGQIGQTDYSAAKAGVAGMSLPAARDLAPRGIRVLTIAPGTFFTPAFKLDEDVAQAKWGTLVPNPQRMGKPDEYGLLVRQIAENDYLNGEVIRIDGAQRLGPKA
jgi:NAD(P)-dependent dehydrogenase (short-subunit alcohol dehydrogenase family)